MRRRSIETTRGIFTELKVKLNFIHRALTISVFASRHAALKREQ